VRQVQKKIPDVERNVVATPSTVGRRSGMLAFAGCAIATFPPPGDVA
jgi:hypothetical protein